MASVLIRESFFFFFHVRARRERAAWCFVFVSCVFILAVAWCAHRICPPLRGVLVCTCFSAGDLQRGEQGRGEQGAAPWGVRGRLRGPHLGSGCVIPLPRLLQVLPLLLPLTQFLLRSVLLMLLLPQLHV